MNIIDLILCKIKCHDGEKAGKLGYRQIYKCKRCNKLYTHVGL